MLRPQVRRLLQKVLAQLDVFITEAEAGHLHEGVLRLGVTELIVHRWLAGFLQAFRDAFPQIVVELEVVHPGNSSPSRMERSPGRSLLRSAESRRNSGEDGESAADIVRRGDDSGGGDKSDELRIDGG